MQKFNIRYTILISILAVFAGITFWIQYMQPVEKTSIDISKIPLYVGEWQGEEIAVDEKTKDILETDAVLMRKYSNPKGEEVILAIVYYKDSRVTLHLPESCYTGQGSHIVKRDIEEINIPKLKNFFANELVLKGDKGNQVILYYFETGSLRTNSYMAFRWQMMKNKIMARNNSGALVRFSTPIQQNLDKAIEILKQFIKEIVPLLPKYLIF